MEDGAQTKRKNYYRNKMGIQKHKWMKLKLL